MKPPEWFESDRAAVDAALENLLPAETVLPASIHRAMRYSVFAGGKRIRPILCLETARIFDRDVLDAMPAACSLEFIHTYSLIHDDLPALDNDDLRRGKPTCHKVFGEAIAILAGDALLTLAFQTLANASIEPSRRVRMIAEIGAAAGTVNGMVGGQVADLEAEGKPPTADVLEYYSSLENGGANSRVNCRRSDRRWRKRWGRGAVAPLRPKYRLGVSSG